MAILTAEQILATKPATEVVPVPEWGGEVIVADMGGTARDRFERFCLDNKSLVGIRAVLAAATIVDERGELLFTPDQLDALGKKSGAALDRVYEVASRLNKLSQKDVEELEKNSEAAPSGGSTST